VSTVYSIEYLTDLTQTNSASAWRSLEFLRLPASPYLWPDKSAPIGARRFYRAVAFAVPSNMVFIPPGVFRMGSPSNEVGRFPDESPQTEVTISRGFWMGKFEVTQGEYMTLAGANPSFFNGLREYRGTNVDFGTDLARPVESVTWSNANSYCAALTQLDRAAGRIPTNCVHRLPTLAEWEYACRALTSTRFSYGEDPGYTNLAQYAWYVDNSGNRTHSVGQKLPNYWGLYDMHGNVWEWCLDSYYPYPGGIAVDPTGPDLDTARMVRGGGALSPPGVCRSAARGIGSVADVDDGFRVVLTISSSE